MGLNRKGKQMLLTLSGLASIGVVTALFLSGMIMEGQLTATPGTQPDAVIYEWNVDISSDNNDTQDFIYSNSDGSQDMTFSLVTDIVSTYGNCTYEEGKDVTFFINTSEWNGQPLEGSPTFTMSPEDNVITLTAQPDPARCPLEGTISVTGVLA